ncbi:MAG: flagellar protein FliT [Gammaproteobacteria bacterium]|nr:flagellar protein FliT [Gammaproteobacteria bacterium]
MQYLSLQQTANKVLRLTQYLLQLARQDAWEAMLEVEQQRQLALTALFQHPQMPQALNLVAQTLQQVVGLDKQCMALGDTARQQLEIQLAAAFQGQRAVREYHSYS